MQCPFLTIIARIVNCDTAQLFASTNSNTHVDVYNFSPCYYLRSHAFDNLIIFLILPKGVLYTKQCVPFNVPHRCSNYYIFDLCTYIAQEKNAAIVCGRIK